MSAPLALRPALRTLGSYHSPQVAARVRLNTNESPLPPPEGWRAAFTEAMGEIEFNRYPDREAWKLRGEIASLHGVTPSEVFCANGSNEVLQCLLLAFGGAGRTALVFEPTYALHSHLAALCGLRVVVGDRSPSLEIDAGRAVELIEQERPEVVFVCSPNNPTGMVEDPGVVAALVEAAPGLCVADEAYGQFASWSALSLRGTLGNVASGLVVMRTFSKTWAMAGARLGYLLADPQIVEGCLAASLPYHLSAQTQVAGFLALRFGEEMRARVREIDDGRATIVAGLSKLPVDTWPSQANFVLFRPKEMDARSTWTALLERGVLIRDLSTRPRLEGCLRVTVGTEEENASFLSALCEVLS